LGAIASLVVGFLTEYIRRVFYGFEAGLLASLLTESSLNRLILGMGNIKLSFC
jgi:hypothetical protein